MPKTSQKHPDRIQIQIRKEKKKIKTRSTNKNQRGGDVTMIESDRGDRWMIPRSSLQDQFGFGLVWFGLVWWEREKERRWRRPKRKEGSGTLSFFFLPPFLDRAENMASIGDGRTTPTTSRPAHSPLPTNGNFYRLLKRQFCPLNYRGGGIQWSAWPCIAVYSSRLGHIDWVEGQLENVVSIFSL